MTDHISNQNITRKRGDDYPLAMTLKDEAGVVINITSFVFQLVVDPSIDPATSADNVLDLTAVLTDAVNGEFEFQPTAMEMDITPDVYFYEVQMTDASSAIRTILQGKFIIQQDIVK